MNFHFSLEKLLWFGANRVAFNLIQFNWCTVWKSRIYFDFKNYLFFVDSLVRVYSTLSHSEKTDRCMIHSYGVKVVCLHTHSRMNSSCSSGKPTIRPKTKMAVGMTFDKWKNLCHGISLFTLCLCFDSVLTCNSLLFSVLNRQFYSSKHQ